MSLLSAAAAAVACWLWLAPTPAKRLRQAPEGRGRRARRGWGPALPGLAAGAASVVGLVVGGFAGAAMALAGALPALTVVLLWRRHRSRSVAAAAAVEVADACRLLAGLIRVGHTPGAALAAAARDAPVLAEAATVQAIGGDVCAVLVRQGEQPGRRGLFELAVAWQLAERTGASLVGTLDALVDRLAGRRKVADVVAAELSAPRATGRLLAVLPLAGLLLGYAFGGDPLGFLTATLPGRLSLVLGVALGCAGVLWTERIAASGSG